MNTVGHLLGLAHAARWTAAEVRRILPTPHLEADARRNARNAMMEITTRRRNYANARAALVLEERHVSRRD